MERKQGAANVRLQLQENNRLFGIPYLGGTTEAEWANFEKEYKSYTKRVVDDAIPN